jgi:glucose/arabinose dehydrogenase
MGGRAYRKHHKASQPFVSGNSNSPTAISSTRYYYAYGIRNAFGLAFDPTTGNLWDTENGEDVYDEILDKESEIVKLLC